MANPDKVQIERAWQSVNAAVGKFNAGKPQAVMQAKLAWFFKCALRARDDLKRMLDSVSPAPWQERDSDSAQDSLTKKITSHAWLRIFEFGLGAYVADLTVEAETEEELATQLEVARRKTFDEILAAVGARDIDVTKPYER